MKTTELDVDVTGHVTCVDDVDDVVYFATLGRGLLLQPQSHSETCTAPLTTEYK